MSHRRVGARASLPAKIEFLKIDEIVAAQKGVRRLSRGYGGDFVVCKQLRDSAAGEVFF